MKKEHMETEFSEELQDFMLGEDCLLDFHPKSPLRPANWPIGKKIKHTVFFGLITFCAQFNSTTLSSSRFVELLGEAFGTPYEVAMLSNSLYILGIALGPMVFAPISEVYGRKIGVLIPFLLSAVFSFACATSYNAPALLVYRFLSGFFCGAPIVSSGGVLSDIFRNPTERGKYLGVYAVFVNLGPSCGPVISSLLMYSRASSDLEA
jgi:MFS family permease